MQLGRPQSRHGLGGEEENYLSFPIPRIEPLSSNPYPSYYTFSYFETNHNNNAVPIYPLNKSLPMVTCVEEVESGHQLKRQLLQFSHQHCKYDYLSIHTQETK